MSSYAHIDKFRAHVKSVGLPIASHFNVLLPPQTGSTSIVAMLCESLALPGLTLMTNELRIVGEVTDMPYMIAYAPINVTFIEDNMFAVRKYFETWTNKVYNRATRTLGFYKDYTSNVDIIVSDRSGKARFCIRLYEAYPKSLQDQSFAYSSHDNVKVEVQLVYKYWKQLEVTPNGEPIEPLPPFTAGAGRSAGAGGILVNGLTMETLGNVTGKLDSMTASLFGADIGSELAKWGPDMGAEFTRMGNGANAVLSTSGMSSGFDLGGSMMSVGSAMGSFGSTIGDLGSSLGNIVGIGSKIGSAVGGVSGTIGAMDSVLKTMGISTGLGKISTDMNQIAGKIGVVSQLKGMPGQLGALGANMGAVSGEISQVVKAVSGLPNTTKQVTNTISNFGNLFGTKGSELSSASSAIQSGIDSGRLY